MQFHAVWIITELFFPSLILLLRVLIAFLILLCLWNKYKVIDSVQRQDRLDAIYMYICIISYSQVYTYIYIYVCIPSILGMLTLNY